MNASRTLLLTLTLPAALPFGSALAQEGPGKSDHSLGKVVVNGSACPVGTPVEVRRVDSRRSGSLRGLVLRIKGYDVKSPAKVRGFCNIAIPIKHTKGWSYGVARLYTAIYAHLQEDVTGTLQVSSEFRGAHVKTTGKDTVSGPGESIVNFSQNLSPIKFSPCGKSLPLNVKIDTWLSGKTDGEHPSVFGVVPFTEAVEQVVEIVWRKC